MSPPAIFGALDVGNRRVLALIAELDEHAELLIRGVGVADSAGMRNGQVVQFKPLVQAIRTAVDEAELMANTILESVWATTAGTFVSGRVTRASITLGNHPREVTPRDLDQLHQAVQRQPLPSGHMVLNVLTHTYTLDDQEGLLDPVEMVGRQLSVEAYVLACQESPVRTLEEAINKAGLKVEEFLFTPVASALACLTNDERRLGSLAIDIGFGNTSYAAYVGDRIVAAGCFPLGGNKINDDLAYRFTTTVAGAEKAKREAASMLLAEIGAEETVSLPTIEGRGSLIVPRLELCKIVRLRVLETFELISADVLRQSADESPATGVVLVGGGSHLEGITEVAEEAFVTRCRLGELEGVADTTCLLANSELPSRSPAAAVGLLAYASGTRVLSATPPVRVRPKRSNAVSKLVRSLFAKKGVEP